MKNKYLLYPLISGLFLMSAMWNPGPRSTIFSESFDLTDRELQVSAYVYTKEESQQILHHDILAQGYVPIEVTIQNQGEHAYAISRAVTSMESVKPKEIAWKVTKGSIPRSIGLKVLGLLFWPFAIVSTADSIYTFKKHQSLSRVLTAKGFKDTDEIVLPYSLVKRLLYVPKDSFYSTFSVSLEDLENDELIVIPVDLEEATS